MSDVESKLKTQRDLAVCVAVVLGLAMVSGLLTFGWSAERRLRAEEHQVLVMEKSLVATQNALRQTEEALRQTESALRECQTNASKSAPHP